MSVPELVTSAVTLALLFTRVTRVITMTSPGSTVPRLAVAVRVGGSMVIVPLVVEPLIRSRKDTTVSVTMTLVAGTVPLLVTVRVKVTMSPMAAWLGLRALRTAGSTIARVGEGSGVEVEVPSKDRVAVGVRVGVGVGVEDGGGGAERRRAVETTQCSAVRPRRRSP